MRQPAVDALALEGHRARVVADDAREAVDQRRLSRPVRADQSDDLATADTERDAMKRSQPTEADAQAVHDQHRVVGRARRSHTGRLLRRAHLAWAPCPAK